MRLARTQPQQVAPAPRAGRSFAFIPLVLGIAFCGLTTQLAGSALTDAQDAGPLLIGAACALIGALLAGFFYIRAIHPFWAAQEAPNLKPFVYLVRGGFFLAIAAFCAIALAGFAGAAGTMFPAGCIVGLALAGGYDLYVFNLAKSLQQRVGGWTDQAGKVSGKLDTGKLADDNDLTKLGLGGRSGLFLGTRKAKPIFCSEDRFVNAITYGEPGCGKGTNTVTPNIMAWQRNLFVTDPKGELAAMTAHWRKNQRQQGVIFLNPWKLHGLPNTPFNPLQIVLDDVAAANRKEIDDATVLANLIYPEPAGSTSSGDANKWIRDNARSILKALILYLAAEQPKHCNLVIMRRMLSQGDDKLTRIIAEMGSSNAFAGELRTLADTIMNLFTETREQFEYARDDALRALSIYDNYGDLGKAVSTSNGLSAKIITERPVTVYMMIPKELIATHSAWMSLVVMNFLEAVGRYGKRATPVLCMLDEFANLKKLPNISQVLATYRGNGLRCWMIVQNRPQLQAVYGKDEAAAIEGYCSIEQYLSVAHSHAKDLSDRIGQKAEMIDSVNKRGTFDNPYDGAGVTHTETLTPVLPAQKITELAATREQLIFVKGTPMLLDKTPYWDLSPWNQHIRDNPIEGPVPAHLKALKPIEVS